MARTVANARSLEQVEMLVKLFQQYPEAKKMYEQARTIVWASLFEDYFANYCCITPSKDNWVVRADFDFMSIRAKKLDAYTTCPTFLFGSFTDADTFIKRNIEDLEFIFGRKMVETFNDDGIYITLTPGILTFLLGQEILKGNTRFTNRSIKEMVRSLNFYATQESIRNLMVFRGVADRLKMIQYFKKEGNTAYRVYEVQYETDQIDFSYGYPGDGWDDDDEDGDSVPVGGVPAPAPRCGDDYPVNQLISGNVKAADNNISNINNRVATQKTSDDYGDLEPDYSGETDQD